MSHNATKHRQSIVELAMARAARNRIEPAVTWPEAEGAERPAGAPSVDEALPTHSSQAGSAITADQLPVGAPQKGERDRLIAPRTQSNRPLLVASHLISAAAGAALMWYVMGEPDGAQKAAPPETTVPGAVTVAADAANPQVAPPPAASATAMDSQVRDTLERWRQAWSSRAVDAYLGFYSAHFIPADGTKRSAWAEARRKNLLSRSRISVQLHDVTVVPIDSRQVKVTLLQDYASDRYTETRQPKTFLLAREGNDWRIAGEWQGTRATLPARRGQRR